MGVEEPEREWEEGCINEVKWKRKFEKDELMQKFFGTFMGPSLGGVICSNMHVICSNTTNDMHLTTNDKHITKND
jgi:hypothetical protein